MIFFSTSFDKTSVDFFENEVGVEFYKIASFELVDIPPFYFYRRGHEKGRMLYREEYESDSTRIRRKAKVPISYFLKVVHREAHKNKVLWIKLRKLKMSYTLK